jgi:hypothetical protein
MNYFLVSKLFNRFQRTLWELGAVPMLQSLTNSKHSTISTCATGALKNLFSSRPAILGSSPEDVAGHPSLQVRYVTFKKACNSFEPLLMVCMTGFNLENNDLRSVSN